MSDGKLEKMDKDFSPQVDALLPETESLAQVSIISLRVFLSSLASSDSNLQMEVFFSSLLLGLFRILDSRMVIDLRTILNTDSVLIGVTYNAGRKGEEVFMRAMHIT